MSSEDFLYRDLPAVGKRVHRLGLAGNYGIDAEGIRAALARGINYLFWTPLRGTMTEPLRAALKQDRERLAVATGLLVGYFGGSVRRGTEAALRALGTEYLDILLLPWLGRMAW